MRTYSASFVLFEFLPISVCMYGCFSSRRYFKCFSECHHYHQIFKKMTTVTSKLPNILLISHFFASYEWKHQLWIAWLLFIQVIQQQLLLNALPQDTDISFLSFLMGLFSRETQVLTTSGVRLHNLNLVVAQLSSHGISASISPGCSIFCSVSLRTTVLSPSGIPHSPSLACLIAILPTTVLPFNKRHGRVRA